MAAINFDSQAVKKQAKLLEEAADQIQNQTIKVINAANEAVAASWSGKAGGIFVKFMQEQSADLASGIASLREIAVLLRDACTSMDKAEAQAKAVVSRRQEGEKMASQQVNAAKLKSTGVNLTNLAAKMKSEMNKLDENIQRYQADKANLAQLTQILQQMGAALGEFSNSYTQADNKAMDIVHKYLGKQGGEYKWQMQTSKWIPNN